MRCHKSKIISGSRTDAVDIESKLIVFLISSDSLAEYSRVIVFSLMGSIKLASEGISGLTKIGKDV
jgi:hypothetical protein